MTTRYFTFGQNHHHEIDGVIYDRNLVVKINGVDEADCRAKMFAKFGARWCGCYQDARNLLWYPRGVVEL